MRTRELESSRARELARPTLEQSFRVRAYVAPAPIYVRAYAGTSTRSFLRSQRARTIGDGDGKRQQSAPIFSSSCTVGESQLSFLVLRQMRPFHGVKKQWLLFHLLSVTPNLSSDRNSPLFRETFLLCFRIDSLD